MRLQPERPGDWLASNDAHRGHGTVREKLGFARRADGVASTVRPTLWQPSRNCYLTAGRKTGTIRPFRVVYLLECDMIPSGTGPEAGISNRGKA